MRNSFLVIASLAFCSIYADQVVAPQPEENKFYIKLGSGASFSRTAEVSAPSGFWDPSPQGYDAPLGTAAVIEAGLGYDFCHQVSADITFAYRPHYVYKKFQTSTSTSTLGYLGTKTRHFKLDIASALFSLYFSGRDIDYLQFKWNSISSALYPIIGGGVGVNQYKIYDFVSTGLPTVNATTAPTPAFASDNYYSLRYRFAYQILAGLEFRYHNRWALSMGYRWFDGKTFSGPRYIRIPSGEALDVGPDIWKIKFSANELFADLKVFF